MKQDESGRWRRDEPSALGPDRSFGGYYRSPDRVVDGKVQRGAPLHHTEDAVLAAVQMGYRVVDEQIERGMRMAQHLRGAAAPAGAEAGTGGGEREPGQAFDAGERLASNAMLSGLQWLETLAREPGNPMRRLLSAEYRMLGDMLGVLRDGGRQGRSDGDEQHARNVGATATARMPRVRIVHDADTARRAVTLRTWAVEREALAQGQELPVIFYFVDAGAVRKLASAHVLHDGETPVLRLSTREDDPLGRWRAAVCSPAGEQVGVIEIEL